MDRLIKLGSDITLLWENYGSAYLGGMWSTLLLALVATVIGCMIGLLCGILNTIPYNEYTPRPKRILLRA
ncbi:MAG TPA: amino acid ABC transporter permease, partial [Candidatus Avilachnospira avicola]|nr:amino acid ABC transporter permease [Candidatus Avilachnospira avicola]